MANKQYDNVGNPGDIYKHAALLNLAEMLTKKARPSSSLTYIDTHAFILESPCRKPAEWMENMGRHLLQHPAHELYFRSEYPHVCSCGYRCSTGLILDLTKSMRGLNVVLAESDPPTRHILKAQIKNEFSATKSRTHTILYSAEDLSHAQLSVKMKAPLLALVDPFKFEDVDWDAIRQGLAAFIRKGTDAIVEVFTFNDDREAVDWPPSPKGLLSRPVAVLNRRPYHLAVYCTATLQDQVAQCCVTLGWQATRVSE